MNEKSSANTFSSKLGSVLQGSSWADFQSRLGHPVIKQSGHDWSCQGSILSGRGGIRYMYCPYGPSLNSAEAISDVVEWWRTRQGLDFVRFEPVGEIDEGALRRVGANRVGEVQPQHTLIVDLSPSENELRGALSSGHRNAVNGAERRGLTFRAGEASKDLKYFLDFIHLTAKRTGFRPHPDAYFEALMETLEPSGTAKLYLAEHEGTPVAAAIALDFEGTRSYAHAASDPDARKLQAAAPLVWHMMLEAKQLGCTEFDLWGIAPEGAPPSHPWAGLTQFKRAFGGVEKSYAGTWELPLRKGRYRAYSLAKRLLNLA